MTDRIAALEKVQPVPTPGKYGIWFCYSLVSAADSTAQVTVERERQPPDADGDYPGGQICAGKFLGKRPDGGWTNWLYCPRRPAGGGCGTADGGIADTEGIIVDLRQYPSVPVLYLLSEYFIPEPRVFAAIDCPDPLRPGNFCRLPFKMSGAGFSKMIGTL